MAITVAAPHEFAAQYIADGAIQIEGVGPHKLPPQIQQVVELGVRGRGVVTHEFRPGGQAQVGPHGAEGGQPVLIHPADARARRTAFSAVLTASAKRPARAYAAPSTSRNRGSP